MNPTSIITKYGQLIVLGGALLATGALYKTRFLHKLVLRHIAAQKALTLSEIRLKFGERFLSPSIAQALLADLVNDGFATIEQRPVEANGRQITFDFYCVTDKGLAFVNGVSQSQPPPPPAPAAAPATDSTPSR